MRVMTSNKMDKASFSGSLNLDELIDWIGELEEYFEVEEIRNPQRVKLAEIKFKGHIALSWKGL